MPDGHLLFADLPNNLIRKWKPHEGATVVRTRTGYAAADVPPGPSMGSNGMTLDDLGRLTICEPGNRRVTRVEADGTITVLASHFDGKALNSPNDLVYRSDGSLYFTDPPHGLPLEDDDPAKELGFNGLYRVHDGEVQLLTGDMTRPNGLAFSPDEAYLYVSNSDGAAKVWMKYAVNADGTLAAGRVIRDATSEDGQPPDGLKVDVEGNLYCTGPGGLWIMDADGEVLGLVKMHPEPANCAWGDADARTLYLTAVDRICRIRLKVPGIRP
jgi:gluconolactonase